MTLRSLPAVTDVPNAADNRARVLINALHSKSGGGLTYLRNVLPLLEQDPTLDLHVCIHETQVDLLPKDLRHTHLHVFDFEPGFLSVLWQEQIAVPKLARMLRADVTFSPANMGPVFTPGGVVLLRNAPGVLWQEKRLGKWVYWIVLYLATLASLVTAKRAIAVSDYARRALAPFGLKSKVSVVPHGIAPVFSPPAKRAKRDPNILAVSDIYIQKNFEVLIRAFAKLHADRDELTLTIAGQAIDHDYYTHLQSVVAELKLGDAVTFTGRVELEALTKLYKRCAVFVFPSTVETFGNPLVEAMASGAPIVSSSTAAMPEVVGDAALLFHPESEDSLIVAITRLLDDKKLRTELCARAVERAKNYSWEQTVAKTAAVLRDAAGKTLA